MLRLDWSLSRLVTQDIKTQPQINLSLSSSSCLALGDQNLDQEPEMKACWCLLSARIIWLACHIHESSWAPLDREEKCPRTPIITLGTSLRTRHWKVPRLASSLLSRVSTYISWRSRSHAIPKAKVEEWERERLSRSVRDEFQFSYHSSLSLLFHSLWFLVLVSV